MVRLTNRSSRSLLAVALGVLLCTVGFAAPVFNPVTDFSTISNPNGVWSLGTEATMGGAFTAFSTSSPNCNGVSGLQVWASSACSPGPSAPYIAKNATGGQYINGTLSQPTSDLNLAAGTSLFAVVRWTAPSTGLYWIGGYFRAIDSAPTSSDVHVVINGVDVFDAGDFTYLLAQPFAFERSLAAGSTIDFMVGNFNGNAANDNNGFSVDIGAPEPGGASLLMLGSAILFAFRMRRTRA